MMRLIQPLLLHTGLAAWACCDPALDGRTPALTSAELGGTGLEPSESVFTLSVGHADPGDVGLIIFGVCCACSVQFLTDLTMTGTGTGYAELTISANGDVLQTLVAPDSPTSPVNGDVTHNPGVTPCGTIYEILLVLDAATGDYDVQASVQVIVTPC